MSNSKIHLARMISLALATAGGFAISSTAIAQGDEPDYLEEIIVTAQKREQSLEEIPLSITVLDGNMLERYQVFDFKDMLALIPGFSIGGHIPGITRLMLRGINSSSGASTVAVYFDDVPFGSSTALASGDLLTGDFDTFDINRIEVLRGPQGTLYGASSLGGVMKYVPNRPNTQEFQGSFKVGLEDIHGGGLGYNATGYINVPLSDTFAIRASAFYRQNEGWIDSIGDRPIPAFPDPSTNIIDGTMVEKGINSSDISGGRVQALFRPSDTFSINLIAMFQNINSDDGSLQEAHPDTFKPLYPSPVAARYQDAFNEISYEVYSATLDWEISDWASLLSVTSWGAFKLDGRDDLAAAPYRPGVTLSSYLSFAFGTPMSSVQEQIISTDKFTQEFRLVSGQSDRFEWLAGLFYTDEDSLIAQQMLAITPNTDTPIPGFPLLFDGALISTYEEIAAFANATWFMTDRFEVSFGARQSDSEQTVLEASNGLLVGGVSEFTGESSESPFTWSISPRFQLNENSSVYARVATGFRPGGPNFLPPIAPDTVPTQHESDTLTNYEIGYKMNSDDGRFALEVAGFYIDWEDIQLFAVVEDFGVIVNGGTAVSKGIEFATRFAATEGLTFSLNGAYIDAYLTSDASSVRLDGDPLLYVPDWSFGLSGDYEWNVFSNSQAYVGGTVQYTGERANGRIIPGRNGEIAYMSDYASLNLRAGLETGRWFYEIYARNVTDKFAVRGVSTNRHDGMITIGTLVPRTIGIAAGARF